MMKIITHFYLFLNFTCNVVMKQLLSDVKISNPLDELSWMVDCILIFKA